MKLSKAQLNILELMNSDWELGLINGLCEYRYWLQKGGLGKGGEVKYRLNNKTIYRLKDLELIKINKKGFPTTSYKLTEKGKQLLDDLK